MGDDKRCSIDLLDDSINLTNGLVTVAYHFRHGHVSLKVNSSDKTCFSKSYILVHTDREVIDLRKMTYRSFSAVDFKEERLKGKAMIIKLQDFEKTAELTVKFSVYENIPGYSVVVKYKNGGNEVRVKGIDPLVLEVDDSSRIVTGWDSDELRFFHHGFHSWELSQSLPIDVGENVSHFYTALKNKKTLESMVFGFVTTADHLSTITVGGREDKKSRLAMIAATSHADNIPVTEKDSIISEELLVLYGKSAEKNLDTYMTLLSMKMNALSWPYIPTGWCSWYFYYTMPDEGEIIKNTEFLAKRFHENIQWIQVDDGYQKRVGDWKENARFGSGLASLVERIKKNGFQAGVWVAPFVASEHSEIFRDRPDWFVRDEDNNPIVVGENPLWLGKFYALDLTNPKVLDHIRGIFTKLKEDGFEYFKIDFLYHAAILGRRFDQTVTRAQAIRKGLSVIREAVGNDMILGCGAPIGPCVGMVNMMRIGNDIATDWRYDWGGGVYECTVNTMTRANMHDRLWVNDPDCVLVRQDDNNLTIAEIRLWLNVVALSGGAILLSDRMMEVSKERLSLIDRILPPYRKRAIAVDALDNENPTTFALKVESPLGEWVVLGLVNLNEKPIDVRVPLKAIGLNPRQPHHVFDFWDEEYHGLVEEEIAIFGLERHSSRLFMVKPESRIPSVLSTNMHFTQGAVELGELEWNASTKELRIRVQQDCKHEGSVFFVFGNEWIPTRAYVDEEQVRFEEVAPEVVAVKHKFQRGQQVRVIFSQ